MFLYGHENIHNTTSTFKHPDSPIYQLFHAIYCIFPSLMQQELIVTLILYSPHVSAYTRPSSGVCRYSKLL
jgi:hypothetical protein